MYCTINLNGVAKKAHRDNKRVHRLSWGGGGGNLLFEVRLGYDEVFDELSGQRESCRLG